MRIESPTREPEGLPRGPPAGSPRRRASSAVSAAARSPLDDGQAAVGQEVGADDGGRVDAHAAEGEVERGDGRHAWPRRPRRPRAPATGSSGPTGPDGGDDLVARDDVVRARRTRRRGPPAPTSRGPRPSPARSRASRGSASSGCGRGRASRAPGAPRSAGTGTTAARASAGQRPEDERRQRGSRPAARRRRRRRAPRPSAAITGGQASIASAATTRKMNAIHDSAAAADARAGRSGRGAPRPARCGRPRAAGSMAARIVIPMPTAAAVMAPVEVELADGRRTSPVASLTAPAMSIASTAPEDDADGRPDDAEQQRAAEHEPAHLAARGARRRAAARPRGPARRRSWTAC